MLDHVDEVQFVQDGVVVARGTHDELAAADALWAAAYQRVVGRSMDDETPPGGVPAVGLPDELDDPIADEAFDALLDQQPTDRTGGRP